MAGGSLYERMDDDAAGGAVGVGLAEDELRLRVPRVVEGAVGAPVGGGGGGYPVAAPSGNVLGHQYPVAMPVGAADGQGCHFAPKGKRVSPVIYLLSVLTNHYLRVRHTAGQPMHATGFQPQGPMPLYSMPAHASMSRDE